MERNGVAVVSSKNSQRANSAQPGDLPGITGGLLKRGYSQYRYSRAIERMRILGMNRVRLSRQVWK
jgi:hypothetical protein